MHIGCTLGIYSCIMKRRLTCTMQDEPMKKYLVKLINTIVDNYGDFGSLKKEVNDRLTLLEHHNHGGNIDFNLAMEIVNHFNHYHLIVKDAYNLESLKSNITRHAEIMVLHALQLHFKTNNYSAWFEINSEL